MEIEITFTSPTHDPNNPRASYHTTVNLTPPTSVERSFADSSSTEPSPLKDPNHLSPTRRLFASSLSPIKQENLATEASPLLQQQRRRKRAKNATKGLTQLAKEKPFKKDDLYGKALARKFAKNDREKDRYAGCKDGCWFAGKVLIGTAIFPLGLYWLCRDQRPSAEDVAIDLHNIPAKTHKTFYILLNEIEQAFVPLYQSFEKLERGFYSLATLQDLLFAELIARTYTLLGKPIDKTLLQLTVASLGINKSKYALRGAAEKFSNPFVKAALLAATYRSDPRIEADIVRSVVMLPCGPEHERQWTFSFLDRFKKDELLSDEEGSLLKGQIWREARLLQQETGKWNPTEEPVVDRLLNYIVEQNFNFPLLSTLVDYTCLKQRGTLSEYPELSSDNEE